MYSLNTLFHVEVFSQPISGALLNKRKTQNIKIEKLSVQPSLYTTQKCKNKATTTSKKVK